MDDKRAPDAAMAAVLAIGDDAVISHRTAASLWRLLRPADGPVHVSLPSRSGRRRRQGIRLHRTGTLRRADMTRRQGIPVTTPARTILDLRLAVSAQDLLIATRQAEVLGLALGDEMGSDGTRSELEHRFLLVCRRAGLPMPEVNVALGAFVVDFLWPDHRLVVETDGYRYHRGRAGFEQDRARDLKLRGLGYDVLRLSYRQVTREPDEVIAVLRASLAPRRAR